VAVAVVESRRERIWDRLVEQEAHRAFAHARPMLAEDRGGFLPSARVLGLVSPQKRAAVDRRLPANYSKGTTRSSGACQCT